MNIQDLIARLEALQVPSGKLDMELGQLIGYRAKRAAEPEGTRVGTGVVYWVQPKSQEYGRLPRFTTSVDDALIFANCVEPDHAGGVSWEPSGYHAKVGNSPYCKGATPAIAICIAALQSLHSRTNRLPDAGASDE